MRRRRSQRFARPKPATGDAALLRHILKQLQQISIGLHEIARDAPEPPSNAH